MYGQVVTDFRQLLARLDAEMNSSENVFEEMEGVSGPSFFGGRSKTERKLRIAMAVRQQIASSLAEHAPDLAYNFFVDSLNAITNPKFRAEAQQRDQYFEGTLIRQIAESDAARGVVYGRESLKSGVTYQHIDLLKKIYASDESRGIEFGQAILSKLKSDRGKPNETMLSSVLSYGASSLRDSKKASNKKPVYTRDELREISEMLAELVMLKSSGESYSAAGYADQIGEFSPARAAQIRAKLSKSNSANSGRAYPVNSSNLMANSESYGMGVAANSNSAGEARNLRLAEREKVDRQLMEDVKSLENRSLPKEDRGGSSQRPARSSQNLAGTRRSSRRSRCWRREWHRSEIANLPTK